MPKVTKKQKEEEKKEDKSLTEITEIISKYHLDSLKICLLETTKDIVLHRFNLATIASVYAMGYRDALVDKKKGLKLPKV